MPDLAAGGGVEREDARAGGDDVHHAVDHDGRGLQVLGVVAGLKHPGGREDFDVGGVDLIERAVAPGELRAAVVRPVGARGSGILG